MAIMMTIKNMRIPPLLQLIAWMLLAGVCREVGIGYEFPYQAAVSIIMAGIGLGCCILGVWEFSKYKTTVNPVSFDGTNKIVTSGIYKVSRNPMYLGFLIMLCGWVLFLGNVFLIAFPVLFVLFINRMQIIPEENILEEKFGKSYLEYQKATRRWI